MKERTSLLQGEALSSWQSRLLKHKWAVMCQRALQLKLSSPHTALLLISPIWQLSAKTQSANCKKKKKWCNYTSGPNSTPKLIWFAVFCISFRSLHDYVMQVFISLKNYYPTLLFADWGLRQKQSY